MTSVISYDFLMKMLQQQRCHGLHGLEESCGDIALGAGEDTVDNL